MDWFTVWGIALGMPAFGVSFAVFTASLIFRDGFRRDIPDNFERHSARTFFVLVAVSHVLLIIGGVR